MSRAARLGAFIVFTLAILGAGVFIIGSRQYLFSPTYQVKAQFSNVAGLDPGADVRVGGVHSGTVHSIDLPHKTGDKVTVLIDLKKSTHEIIKQDSVATIETEGMLGNQYLAISFGSSDSPNVRDGDMLASQQPLEMADLLKKASVLLDSTQQTIQNTTLATANLNSISAKIDHGEGTVGALVNDRQLYTNLQQTTGTLHETMIQAQAGVSDFHENMEALKHNFLLRGYFKNRGYEDSGDLARNEIERMPTGTPIKEFTYSSKRLFDKQDSAKLKNQKSLRDGGEFLASNQFGFAVIVVSAGKEGDTQKELVLTEARAMVVREYLVDSFGFDDSHLKTLGVGKQANTDPDADWGTVRILIYPAGAEVPRAKESQAAISSSEVPGRASQAFLPDEPKARD
jgi:phospholipid/cholesterol/gamma-HCH transport system substrate-binding protein